MGKTVKMQFKTSLKCGGCVSKVSDSLNRLLGADNWYVDLQTNPKILSVFSDAVAPQAVADALQQDGYTAEQIS